MGTIRLEVLKKGYLIVVPPADGPPQLARTTDTGEIVICTEAEVDGEPAKTPLLFVENASYAVFWTQRRALWKRVWKRAKANAKRAIAKAPFSAFKVARRDTPTRAPGIEKTWDDIEEFRWKLYEAKPSVTEKMMLLLADRRGMFRDMCVHGYYDFDEMFRFGAEGLTRGASYVIGRSDAIAAYHVAEALTRHTVDLAVERMDRWAVFESSKGLVDLAGKRHRVPEFDKDLGEIVTTGPDHDEPMSKDAWPFLLWRYAYETAEANRIDHELFWDAVDMEDPMDDVWKDGDGEWPEYGQKIYDKTTMVTHPFMGNWRKWPGCPDKMNKATLRYFDFYSFGHRNKKAWIQRTDSDTRALASESESFRVPLAAFLRARVPTTRLLQELEAHYADSDNPSPDCRQCAARAVEGYLRLAIHLKHPWDETFKPEDETQWAEELRDFAEGAATIFDKMGELIGKVLGDPMDALKFNEELMARREGALRFFKSMEALSRRYEELSKTTAWVDRTTGEGTSIRIVTSTGQIHVRSATGSVLTGSVGLFERTITTEKLLVQQTSVTGGSIETVTLRRAKTAVIERTFTGERVPLKEIKKWPAWIAHFGDALSLAMMFHDLANGKDRDFDMCLQMAQNSFQFVGSLSVALQASFRFIPKFGMKVLVVAGGIGQTVEWIINMKQGVVVFFGYDAETAALKERGDDVVVTLHYVKTGVLMVAAPGAAVGFGISALIAAEAATAAIFLEAAWAGFCVGLGVGALVALAIGVAIALREGPPDAMAGHQRRLDEALAHEYGKKQDKAVCTSLELLRDYKAKGAQVMQVLAEG
jgi:hypothetical protein